jgi:hypothetical protein
VRKRFINICLASNVPGINGNDAGLLYDALLENQDFSRYIDEMRAANHWTVTGVGTTTHAGAGAIGTP